MNSSGRAPLGHEAPQQRVSVFNLPLAVFPVTRKGVWSELGLVSTGRFLSVPAQEHSVCFLESHSVGRTLTLNREELKQYDV